MRKVRSIRRRIGVVGTQNSGKTVFLTSLINHLRDHEPHDFVLGAGARVTKFQTKKIDKRMGEALNYAAYRDALVYKGKWPQKTRDLSHFICSFNRSDWRASASELHLFDFPGERAADAGVAANAAYDDWSDYVIEHLSSHSDYGKHAEAFFGLLDGPSITVDRAVAEYKLVLAKLILDYKPLISPSTFLLDTEGTQAQKKPAEEIARDRFSGLKPGPKTGEDRQFAPLSEAARARNPKVAELFRARYDEYRAEVALPVFMYLRSCHRLIVLLDIPSMLAGGVGMYNDNRDILESFFEALRPGSGIGAMVAGALVTVVKLGSLGLPLQLLTFGMQDKLDAWLGQLDRIAFVATKSDLVRPGDVKSERLRGLLKQMTEKFAYDRDDIKSEWFTCSAVISAKAADSPGRLRGKLFGKDNPEKKVMEFAVPELPDSWPDDWRHGDYPFSHVYPEVPANKGNPPAQEGLDRVFDFIAKD